MSGRLDPEAARQFFETNFVPVRIRKLGDPSGILTAYYEPIVDGSRFPTREFTVPLYRRPRDLVAPRVAGGGPFPNTGRAFRRSPTGKLVPYYDRGEIEDGALDGRHLEICWLRTAADALSIEMEGSGRVRLEDGSMLRISYDAHNGYSYVPAGRVLIERNLMPREGVSPQRIRQWLHDHPESAKEVRRQNRQVVFFRIVGLDDDTETIGGQGIPLSPGRSIAVDKALHRYGTPFFIEADLPLTSPVNRSSFRRIMIAQDTGSAIVGPARADLYFGAGNQAGQVAERIRQNGRFTILLPREIDPTAAGARMPLPPVKAWRQGVVVYEGELASFGGQLYQAKMDTGLQPGDPEAWVCVACAGKNATQIAPRGEWSASASYGLLNLVIYQGGSYLATRDIRAGPTTARAAGSRSRQKGRRAILALVGPAAIAANGAKPMRG